MMVIINLIVITMNLMVMTIKFPMIKLVMIKLTERNSSWPNSLKPDHHKHPCTDVTHSLRFINSIVADRLLLQALPTHGDNNAVVK